MDYIRDYGFCLLTPIAPKMAIRAQYGKTSLFKCAFIREDAVIIPKTGPNYDDTCIFCVCCDAFLTETVNNISVISRQCIYAEPKMREPFQVQVNIGCDLHVSSPVCLTDAVHVLLHVEVTLRSHPILTWTP